MVNTTHVRNSKWACARKPTTRLWNAWLRPACHTGLTCSMQEFSALVPRSCMSHRADCTSMLCCADLRAQPTGAVHRDHRRGRADAESLPLQSAGHAGCAARSRVTSGSPTSSFAVTSSSSQSGEPSSPSDCLVPAPCSFLGSCSINSASGLQLIIPRQWLWLPSSPLSKGVRVRPEHRLSAAHRRHAYPDGTLKLA